MPADVVRSDGPLAVQLAGAYGLVGDDWQADGVTCTLSRRSGNRWAATTTKITVPRQNGKNAILEIVELYVMVVLGMRVLHTAHEVKTARKAFVRLKSFFGEKAADPGAKFPDLNAMVREVRNTNGQEAIFLHDRCAACSEIAPVCQCGLGRRLVPGGSIEFIARSKGSGRGFTVDVLVCDEDQELTDAELAALLPTISAPPSGQSLMILTGTPPDPDRPEAAQGEVARRTRREAIDGTDPDLYCVDYGAPDGPLPDVDDESLWYRYNPALGSRLSLASVRREHKRMSPEKFARERLGWWGDPKVSSVAIFGGGRWDEIALDGDELGRLGPLPQPAALGISVSLTGDWCSLGAAGQLADGRMLLAATDRREGTGWAPAEVKRIQGETGCAVLVDEKCPDATLIERLRDEGVDLTVLSQEDVIEATAGVLNEVKDASVTHLDNPLLNAAVTGAAWRYIGDRKVFGRKVSTGDISLLEAVTWAHRGAVLALDYEVEDSLL